VHKLYNLCITLELARAFADFIGGKIYLDCVDPDVDGIGHWKVRVLERARVTRLRCVCKSVDIIGN
jgi:hypothetical protein